MRKRILYVETNIICGNEYYMRERILYAETNTICGNEYYMRKQIFHKDAAFFQYPSITADYETGEGPTSSSYRPPILT